MLVSRDSRTIQTHTNVSIPLSGSVAAVKWESAKGYDQVAVTLLNDANTASSLNIYWSNDGATIHGNEVVIAQATTQQKAGRTGVKAEWFKLVPVNGDAAAAHVMNAWAYLIS